MPSDYFENSVLVKTHAVKTVTLFSAYRIVSQAAQGSVKTVALLGQWFLAAVAPAAWLRIILPPPGGRK